MPNHFVTDPTSAGLIVGMKGDPPVPVSEWTAHAVGMLGVGALIRLRDDGGAIECDNGTTLCVYWKSVAGLTSDELRYTGLPDAAPCALEVVTNGAIHDPDFEIRCGYIRDGRRVPAVQREGAWLHAGGEDFVLLDPLYSIAEAINRFNRAEETDLESRMLRWGQIVEMLPADAVVSDENLRSLKIAVASSFELTPFVNDDGEPDFDPVVGRRETHVNEAGEEEQAFAVALPLDRQKEFARRFRGLSRVKHRYAAGGGSYVVLTPEIERALAVVRRAQAGSSDERRDFLRNVSGYLRGAFDDDGTDAVELDSIFSDEGLSERVKGVGIWVDKVLLWIKLAKAPWLPPEEFGILIDGRRVVIPPEGLEDVYDRLKKAIECGEPTVQVRIGNEPIEIPADQTTLGALEELRSRLDRKPKRDQTDRDVPVEPEESDQVLEVIDNLDEIRFRRERRPCRPGISTVAPALQTELLPHQQKGLEWLQRHWEVGNWGALLADDMGLGKTLEALAFLFSLKRHAETLGLQHRPILVVAPTGLLRNWKDEHDKHLSGAGLGRVVEAHGIALRALRKGTTGRGGELADGQPLLDLQPLKAADWVLTTYETLRDYQHSFGRVRWRAGVFDEAQKIKNPGARLTDAALAMNVDFALLLTGTPVENRPGDIWSMLDRAEPGMFGPLREFSQRYEAGGVDGASALAELHDRLTAESDAPALMLRRLKEDHIPELPEKDVHRRVVEMPKEQAEAYAEFVMNGGPSGNILQTLHHLRSISLHPAAPGEFDIDKYIQASARLSEAFRILDQIEDIGQKALLFVEARWMQDFLVGALRRRFSLSEDVLVINGTVAGRIRKARVDTFQERTGFDVMILSPRAGGVGLTLTAANHVIHLSRWWNPAVEDQCTDRVFRIGQRRTVHVYLPIARHPEFGDYSFDIKLDSLMEGKREMNRRVLAPTAATKEDVSNLYQTTMTEARDSASGPPHPVDRTNIDQLEPEAFEAWVLRQLQIAGYDTRRTPRSRDCGADGLAVSCAGGDQHTIVVQCKHTQQQDAKCGPKAVEEVLHSLPAYEEAIRGDVRPMVVTNGAGFTAAAKRLAAVNCVRLVDRNNLSRLRFEGN